MSSVSVLPQEVLDRLRERYQQPTRTYHSFGHAGRVARLVAELGGSRPCLLAAWFHDAVYEPGSPDNEARSADLLLDWMPDDPDAARAAALVRVTATHAPPAGDADAAVLCDADLAVLGGDDEAYATYVRAVRAEHADLSDAAWAAGRGQVLRTLLARRPLFATPEGRRRWEDAAWVNMRRELASLTV